MKLKLNEISRFIILIIYVSFSGYLVGVKDPIHWKDYYTYLEYYTESIQSFGYIFKNVQDPLFTSFIHLFSSFNYSFDFFLLICAYLTIYIKISSVLKVIGNLLVFLFLYSSYLLYLHDYTQIRVSLAIAIFCLSIYRTKGVTRLLLLTLSIAIHFSSVLLMAIYYLWKFKIINEKRLLRLFLLCFLFSSSIYFFGSHISRINNYLILLKSGVFGAINIYSPLPFLQLVTIAVILKSKKFSEEAKSLEFILSFVGVTIFYSNLYLPTIALRFYELTSLFFIILLSRLFRYSLKIKIISLLYILIGIRYLFMFSNYNGG